MNDKVCKIIASVISFFAYLAGSVLLLYSLYSDHGKVFLVTICALPLCTVLYCGIYSFVLTTKCSRFASVKPAGVLCIFLLPYAVFGILLFAVSIIVKEDYVFDTTLYLIFFTIIAAVSFAASKLSIALNERKLYKTRVSEIKSGERID